MRWRWVVVLAVLGAVAGLGYVAGRETERLSGHSSERGARSSVLGAASPSASLSLDDISKLLPLKGLLADEEREPDGPGSASSVGTEARYAERDLGPRKYLRVTRSPSQEPRTLESAIITFRPQPGSVYASLFRGSASVSLVGAIHIGEPSYYDRINEELRRYERVLYEMVGPRGVRPLPEHEAGGTNLFSAFQYLLTDYFGMVHQVDRVDYSPRHFVHADLSMEDLVAEGERRGESMVSFGVGILGDMIKSYNKLSRDLGRANGLGRRPAEADSSPPAMLHQFAEVMARTGAQDIGETLEPYLIDVRNAEALRVLRGELRAGARHIAIFYGAAHLPKMEESLRQEFGLIPVAERWITAWDLRARRGERVEDGVGRVLPRVRRLLKSSGPRVRPLE